MNDPLQAIGQSAVNAGAEAVSAILNMAISKTVDFVLGDTPEFRKKITEDYYSKVREIVDKHDLPRGTPYVSPQQHAMNEIDKVDQLIVDGVRNFEEARNLSRCNVCKSSLEETIGIVKKQVEPIFDATDKIRAMQKLKATRKLPQDAMWDGLTEKQKKEVERVAGKIATPRDFSPAPPQRPVRPKFIMEVDKDEKEPVERKPRKARISQKGRKRN